MLEKPNISHDTLGSLLLENYGLAAATLTFLAVGDTHSAIYRVDTPGGPFLLKLRPSFDEARLRASRYLCDNGIAEAIAPLTTKSGALTTQIDSYIAVVFPFVEGDTGWATIEPRHWTEAGRIFSRIHSLPAEGAASGLNRERYDPSTYATAVQALEGHTSEAPSSDGALGILRGAWQKHRVTIRALADAMRQLAATLKAQALPFVICHADLHPGNLLRDSAGRVFVIDWDDVMLAPKERDFIFVGEPADGTNPASLFFAGYGPTNVNWTAVTYYRYERVVQDLIEYARDGFRDHLSEATKLHSIGRFVESLEGRNFAAAEAAAERLPAGLADWRVQRST